MNLCCQMNALFLYSFSNPFKECHSLTRAIPNGFIQFVNNIMRIILDETELTGKKLTISTFAKLFTEKIQLDRKPSFSGGLIEELESTLKWQKVNPAACLLA